MPSNDEAAQSSIALARSILDTVVWWFNFLTSAPIVIIAFIIAYGGGYVSFELTIIALLAGIFVGVYDVE